MSSSQQTPPRLASVLLLTGAWLLSDVQRAAGQQATAGPKSKSTVQRFIEGIESADRNVRRQATYTTLRQIGPNDKDGVPLILEALKTSDNTARALLNSALVRIGPAAIPGHLLLASRRSGLPVVRYQ